MTVMRGRSSAGGCEMTAVLKQLGECDVRGTKCVLAMIEALVLL